MEPAAAHRRQTGHRERSVLFKRHGIGLCRELSSGTDWVARCYLTIGGQADTPSGPSDHGAALRFAWPEARLCSMWSRRVTHAGLEAMFSALRRSPNGARSHLSQLLERPP